MLLINRFIVVVSLFFSCHSKTSMKFPPQARDWLHFLYHFADCLLFCLTTIQFWFLEQQSIGNPYTQFRAFRVNLLCVFETGSRSQKRSQRYLRFDILGPKEAHIIASCFGP
jgi:hypothetical protein